MKHYILIACLVFSSLLVNGQYSYDDIFRFNKAYFYGYDFTHFKFIEPKRSWQDSQIRSFIFEEIQWLNERRSAEKYASWLIRDTVIFAQDAVNALNAKIIADHIIGKDLDAFQRHSIPKDSLQGIVNAYDTNGKSGIGFVQIVECFYKAKKEVSIWYVFFDTSTKKILDAHENFNVDADSYHGLAAYWGVGMSIGMDQYHAYYKKRKKESLVK